MNITNIIARYPGSVHDSRIFNECQLKQEFETREMGILLGDPGYACLPYLMTPIVNRKYYYYLLVVGVLNEDGWRT
jgi:hypothetical protein